MPTDKTIPGFRRHGKPGNFRAWVTMPEADAERVRRIADIDGAPLASVLRRAVRFYLATLENTNV